MRENSFILLRTQIKHVLSQSLVFATLTTTGVILSMGLSAKADAQPLTVNDAEVTNYAQSVLAMEPKRQQAFEEIKKLIGGKEIPKIVCNDPNSMKSLPGKAKDIAVNYCNDSQKIVASHNLTFERFNQITAEYPNNSTLKQQIYDKLITLQKASAAKSGAPNTP